MAVIRVGMLLHGYYRTDPRVRREAEALARAGCEVEVVCLRRPQTATQEREAPTEVIDGVRVHRVPLARQRGSQLRYLFEYTALTVLGALKLASLHFHKRFDVVHIHNMPDFLVLAGLVPKWTGARLVLDIHDPMVELYTTKPGQPRWLLQVIRWQEKLACRVAHKVVSVNESMRENLQRKGIARDKIFIIHNFPDDRYFPKLHRNHVWPRHRESPVLLYCGTITDHYRLDVAVEAVALASKEIPGLRLRVVGEGNKENDIRDLVRRRGIEDRVEFLGPVGPDRVRDLMAEADIGVSTRQADVFGDLCFSTKILEYLSQDLPVVSSRTETMLRYIPEDTIFYFQHDNSADMARQIVRMWNQPAVVKQALENAQELLSRYTWQVERERLAEFYRNLSHSRQDSVSSNQLKIKQKMTDSSRERAPSSSSAKTADRISYHWSSD